MDYERIRIRQAAAAAPGTGPTAEDRFWQRFRPVLQAPHHNKITDIHFKTSAPYDFCVTASTRCIIYDFASLTVKKTISRFQDVAYSGHFRRDGRLLAAGSADGVVRVFDVASRNVLRQFTGHESGVQVARFARDQLSLMSCSDDRTVRQWDMMTARPIAQWHGHTDLIRAGAWHPSRPTVFVSAAYDHQALLWDTRQSAKAGPVQRVDHGFPIEDLCVLPGGNLLATAGDRFVKVWDLLKGGAQGPVEAVSAHQKTITAVAVDATAERLLSSSLDQHVKCYDLRTFQVTQTLRYDEPILSMALSPCQSVLAVGLANGDLSVRRRDLAGKQTAGGAAASTGADPAGRKRKKPLLAGTRAFFARGQTYKPPLPGPDSDDIHIEAERQRRLQPFDRLLKKFAYSKALDACLAQRPAPDPVVVVSLLHELVQRGALVQALARRTDAELEPLLHFLSKYVTRPRFADLLLDVYNVVLDLYSASLGQSQIMDEMFVKLRYRLRDEARFQTDLRQLQGAVSLLVAAIETNGLRQQQQQEEDGDDDGDEDAAGGDNVVHGAEAVVEQEAAGNSKGAKSKKGPKAVAAAATGDADDAGTDGSKTKKRRRKK